MCELLTDLQVKSTENEIKHGTNSRSEYYYNIKKWLKSLKDRVQPKQEWNEEDERIIKRIDLLLYAINENDFEDIHAWLKSIKTRIKR